MYDYSKKIILTEKTGNNGFAWDRRLGYRGHPPTLIVPAHISGRIEDVKIGRDIVFEEKENDKIKGCVGLEHFVSLEKNDDRDHPPMTIVDNHNHALNFWLESVRVGKVGKGFELIHIDEHSDLWDNEYPLDVDQALSDQKYAWEYTNLSCNVGNYIIPALESGLISKMIRIENEHEIDTYMDYTPSENSILNLDLDIFAPEMDFIPVEKKLEIVRNLLPKVKYVTIATSPYFIDQGLALQKLHQIFQLKKSEI